jgi:double-strand break repair protein MRE11
MTDGLQIENCMGGRSTCVFFPAVSVSPILIAKGSGDQATKLALYGLGNIRDDRFSRMLRTNAVKFTRPDVDPNSWFSLFLIHQNRSV